jgi:hypothetical protein
MKIEVNLGSSEYHIQFPFKLFRNGLRHEASEVQNEIHLVLKSNKSHLDLAHAFEQLWFLLKFLPELSVEELAQVVTNHFQDTELSREITPWGHADILFENQLLGLYRLDIAPLKTIPLHYHEITHEMEMSLSPGIICNGIEIEKGSVFEWGKD